MARETFIPNWYIEKKSTIRNKKIKICIMVVLILNIILLSLIINNSNKIGAIDQPSINGVNNRIIETSNLSDSINQDIVAIEKYKEFSNFFNENKFTYKNILITKSNLEIDIEVESYEDYLYIIRRIENKYSIKKLTPYSKSNENFNFKVILEV